MSASTPRGTRKQPKYDAITCHEWLIQQTEDQPTRNTISLYIAEAMLTKSPHAFLLQQALLHPRQARRRRSPESPTTPRRKPGRRRLPGPAGPPRHRRPPAQPVFADLVQLRANAAPAPAAPLARARHPGSRGLRDAVLARRRSQWHGFRSESHRP